MGWVDILSGSACKQRESQPCDKGFVGSLSCLEGQRDIGGPRMGGERLALERANPAVGPNSERQGCRN